MVALARPVMAAGRERRHAALALAALLVAGGVLAAGEQRAEGAGEGEGAREAGHTPRTFHGALRRGASYATGCDAHSKCKDGEFCAADLCGAWDVRHPCGSCRRCDQCQCDSQAVDQYCPESCVERSQWVEGLAGLFYRIDGACISAWIFEGGTFRVLRGHTLPDPVLHGPSSGECSVGPSYETGAFSLDISGGTSTLTLDFAWSSHRPRACARRSARLDRDCQNMLVLRWLEQGGCGSLAPTTLFRQGTLWSAMSAGDGGGGEVSVPGVSWNGTIAMHTTNCSVNMQWRAVVPQQGIYAWVADVFDCQVSPDFADPNQLRQTSKTQFMRSRRLQERSGADLTHRTLLSSLDSQVYEFDVYQHRAYDIVHPKLCFNTRTFLQGDASDVANYNRNPEWQGLGKMPNGTSCPGHVPQCHERASCAVFFIGHGFRDPENPDPAYDHYMRDCHHDGSLGIFDPYRGSTVGRTWQEIGRQRPERGREVPAGMFYDRLKEAIAQKGIAIWSGQMCEFSQAEIDKMGGSGSRDLDFDSYARVEHSIERLTHFFKQVGSFGNVQGWPERDLWRNCSARLWNVTHECVCNAGWIGDGRCCLDQKECTDGSHNCHASASCSDCETERHLLEADIAALVYEKESLMKVRLDLARADAHINQAFAEALSKIDETIHKVGTRLRKFEDEHAQNLPCTSEGAFKCLCNKGYNGSGVRCGDIDECSREEHNCHRFAQCHNVPGSFYCACKTGFADAPATGLAPGVMCRSESKVILEQIYMVGQNLRMVVAWEDKTGDPHNNGTVLALFKHTECTGIFFEEHIGSNRMPDAGCRRGMRQLFWVHTKSIITDTSGQGCVQPMARCADNTCNPCLSSGNEHNFATAQTFSIMPVGFGNFTLMLWSFAIGELIAVSSFSIAPPIAAGVESLGVPRGLDQVYISDLDQWVVMITTDIGDTCGHMTGDRPFADFGDQGSVRTITGAYRVQVDGFVKYCVERIARYGTEEASIREDANFTAFGGLMDCIGRHPICTSKNSACSAKCNFDAEDTGYYMPVKVDDEQEDDSLNPSVCGDGRLTIRSVEQCDDKNKISGDGCSEDCQMEPGYRCIYTFCENPSEDIHSCYDSVCSWIPVCGDGYVNADIGEECDDFNLISSDGCGTDCRIEPGWTCEIMKRAIPPKSRCFGIEEEVCGMYGANACKKPAKYAHLCPTPCHMELGRCIWYRGINYCRCAPGYVDPNSFRNDILTQEMINVRPHTCFDLNECFWNVDTCMNDTAIGGCVNTIGSFLCSCGRGYVGDGLYASGDSACVNRNECSERKDSSITGYVHMCHTDARCSDTVGSYACTCNFGFEGRGSCCGLSSLSECGVSGSKAYITKCYDSEDGCMDINECERNTHNCNQQAECINTKGSFECSCLFGLLGSGVECYKAGYYDINEELWQRMGQDGSAANARGLVQFNTWGDIFTPDKAGFASWIFSGESGPSATHKALYGLAGSVNELTTCQRCQERNRVIQRQCSPGVALGSPACPAAKGLIHLGGMALTGHVKCTWEFSSMPFVEFTVSKFYPISHGDVLQFCYGGSYSIPGQPEMSCCKTCLNFSTSNPPPALFHAAAPCTVTFFAVSAFTSSSRERIIWSSLSPSASRFTMSYVSMQEQNPNLNIEAYFSLPKYEVNRPPQELGIRSKYLRISISNYVGPQSQIPCALNHQGYHDFSSLAIEPSASPLSPVLQGSWRGTCKSGIEACKVDVLFFGSSSIQILYAGCGQESPGIKMPTVQTAVYSFADSQEREARRFLDQQSPQPQWLYRRMHLTWTGPGRSPAGSLSKASLAWPRHTSFAAMNVTRGEVLLHILPSGTKTQFGADYPGDYPELVDVQQEDCAVLYLRKLITQTDLPLLRPPRTPASSVNMALFLLYAECNSTIAKLVAQGSACGGLNTILQPSGAGSFEMPADACRQKCVAMFQTEVMNAASLCRAQWKDFLERVSDTEKFAPDPKYVQGLERRFIARIGFVGDLLMRIQLACNFGLFQRSCMWVNDDINARLTSVCPQYRSSSVKDGAFFYVLPELTGLDSIKQICASCSSVLRKMLREGHCCVSTALNLKRRLLDLFLPGTAVSRVFDLSDYLCLSHSKCDARPEEGVSNLITLSREAVSTCAEGSRKHTHLECLSLSCALGYPWPMACCQWHACDNGGSRVYEGACWCKCVEPFSGPHCSEKQSHVKILLELRLDLMMFDERVVRTSLAKTVGLDASSVEMQSFLMVTGRRNLGEKLGKAIIQAEFRVKLPPGRDLLPFSRQVRFLVDSGTFNNELQAAGIIGANPMMIAPPRAISLDGFVCDNQVQACPGAPVEVGQPKAVDSPSASISLTVILYIVSSLFAAILCCGFSICCYLSRFRHLRVFLNNVRKSQPEKASHEEGSANPLDQPSNLRFATTKSNQSKSRAVESEGHSDTLSMKSGETRSSVRFTRGTAADNTHLDLGGRASVRSGVTTRSNFTVFEQLKSSAREPSDSEHFSKNDSTLALSTTDWLPERSAEKFYGPTKTEPSISRARAPAERSNSVSFENAEENSIADGSYTSRQTMENFGNFTSRSASARLNKIQQDQRVLAAKQHRLMSAAGLVDEAAASRHREAQMSQQPTVASPASLRADGANVSMEGGALSPRLSPAAKVKADAALSVSGSDPWMNRGKPPQLWGPASTVNKSPLFRSQFTGGASEEPDVYIRAWLKQSAPSPIQINYTAKPVVHKITPSEDAPSQPVYVTSRQATEDIESEPAFANRDGVQTHIPQKAQRSVGVTWSPDSHRGGRRHGPSQQQLASSGSPAARNAFRAPISSESTVPAGAPASSHQGAGTSFASFRPPISVLRRHDGAAFLSDRGVESSQSGQVSARTLSVATSANGSWTNDFTSTPRPDSTSVDRLRSAVLNRILAQQQRHGP